MENNKLPISSIAMLDFEEEAFSTNEMEIISSALVINPSFGILHYEEEVFFTHILVSSVR